MTSLDDPRASYWNHSYRKYWQERVAESKTSGHSEVQKGDSRTEGDWVYERIFDAHPFKPGTILDVGCAWGRMFPIYHRYGLSISGVDISEAMIEAARTDYQDKPEIEKLEVAIAEQLPFANSSFDNIVCVAVFDATYQHKALAEFLRILKPGGRLYLTGKNDNYNIDDELALAAEKGARSKGHPNYFTDVKKMREAVNSLNYQEIAAYTFSYRGDFAEFKFSSRLEVPFYEWFWVIESPKSNIDFKLKFDSFSSDYSKTFHKHNL